MIDTTKLQQVDDDLQSIYSDLNYYLLIDYMPAHVGPFIITIFNEDTYSFLITSLLRLINEHNRLVDILVHYNLNPFGDIHVSAVFYDNKGSDLNELISVYNQTLDLLTHNFESIKVIMKLNGLMEAK
ncbi:hypothetical protein FOL01_1313 [Weissella jogaejeotgali]|uniref:Uncharacterized protein n=1 Tax=Weissella jogaejeotgali TaxID=1631871 RepID=A0A1L6RCH4_9LACO|nr:hypothetical protein [Weissella jogaejeotgali]APS42172.1 hypothetical protein FOL01_1313 [Weissella jogaejeotgali]